MSKKVLLPLIVILSLLFPSLVLSQTSKIKNYTVKKGDTLWSISRAELGNAFLWPKVWKANPDISKPDRLRPGQIVKIPIYVKQKIVEETPAPRTVEKEKPAEKKEEKAVTKRKPVRIPLKPLVSKSALVASGYISDTIPSVGTIDGSPSGRTLFGEFDLLFINVKHPVKPGDKFFVIKAVKLEKPEATTDKGYIIEPLGLLEVTKIDGKDRIAKVVRSVGPLRNGDLLDTYTEMEPPLTTGKFRKPAIKGKIIAARNLQLLNAMTDIVYIDKGMKDGIEIGDMFRTIDRTSGHTIKTGTIQVINVKKTTSTAVVRENIGGPISAGNLFVQLK